MRAAALASLSLLAACELLIKPDEVPPPVPCVPADCVAQGKDCGTVDDGCGKTQECGSCAAPKVCGGGTLANVCAACVPRCRARACGPDGCGGSCGACPPGSVCDAGAGTCVGCLTDADCAASPLGPRCHPTLRTCVGCLNALDCEEAGRIPCDPATHRCAAACAADADCRTVAGAPRCDTAVYQCVACLTGQDCAGTASPFCLTTDKICVACRDDADCPAPDRPVCRDRAACVECTGDGDCSGWRCDPATDACVECLQDADCADATPRCSPRATCVECLSPADCPGGVCGADGSCAAPAAAGDTCATPLALPIVNGLAVVSGDTAELVDDAGFSCGGGGPDVVYQIDLAQAQDVDVIAWPDEAAFRPVVAVRKACADTAAAAELACARGRAAGEPAAASLRNLPAGRYFVWVDGFYTSRGAYTLAVLVRPPLSPAPDACAKAQGLVFDADGWAHARGDTRGLVNDVQGSCGGSTSPDAAFGLTLTQARSLDAVVTALDGSPDFIPALYLRSGCTLPTELACDADTTAPGAAEVVAPRLAAGSYVLWVDGVSGSAGAFALWVGLDEPVNDTCSDTQEILFDATRKATVLGSTLAAANDTSATCGGTGPDVFYRVALEAGDTLTAKITALSADFDPILSLRSTCSSAASELACVHGDGKTLSAGVTAKATYWLVVDGYDSTRGLFSLAVSR